MTIHLDRVILLGRCLDEYRLMFNLTEEDLTKNIVSIADGPASTRAQLSNSGARYTSVDPIYELSPEEIEASFYSSYDDVFEKIENDPLLKTRKWIYFKDAKNMKSKAGSVFETFITDYRKHANSNVYIAGQFPNLPFEDQQFDLALCSHLLILYDNVLDYEFHLNAIKEMMRIANEARIYPTHDLSFDTSKYVPTLLEDLNSAGYEAYLEPVDYQIVDIDNHAMIIRRT